jgi:hypothetical protein
MVTFKYIRVPCQNAQDLEERCVVVGDHDDAEGSEVAAFFGKATSIRLSLLIRPTAGTVALASMPTPLARERPISERRD